MFRICHRSHDGAPSRWLAVALLALWISGCAKPASMPEETAAAPDQADEVAISASDVPGAPFEETNGDANEVMEIIAESEASTSEAAPSIQPLSSKRKIQPWPSKGKTNGSSGVLVAPPSAEMSLQTRPHARRDSVIEEARPSTTARWEHLPAGAAATDQGFATVQVYYATDRAASPVSLSDIHLSGQKETLLSFVLLGSGCFLLILLSLWRRRIGMALTGLTGITLACAGIGICVLAGEAHIEKHGIAYTGQRGELVRGVCEVTVPDVHQRGELERPSLLRFEFREETEKHLVLRSAVQLDRDAFHEQLGETLSQSAGGEVLVFIHGYNVDFESAVHRTAQIAVDLPFRGVPICYSWPSQGTLWGYTVDENNVAWSTPHLKEFLLELSRRSGARSVNVVAHSMGNRALTQAVSELSLQHLPGTPAPLDRVVLAAPDIDADLFRRQLADRLLNVSRHVTLYASATDQALIASKQVHGYPRAGDSGEDLVVVPGIDTIDVTGVDLSLLGHSYYGDSGLLLRDLFGVVHHRLAASQRPTLRPREFAGSTYWQLVTPVAATRSAGRR